MGLFRTHTNAWDHTRDLLQYMKDFPLTQEESINYILRRMIIIHDLSEKKLRDVTQGEGKTDEFRTKESQAIDDIVQEIYEDGDYEKMKEASGFLKDKNSDYYHMLKIYETFSHIDGILFHLDNGNLRTSQKSEYQQGMEKHLTKPQEYRATCSAVESFLTSRKSSVALCFGIVV